MLKLPHRVNAMKILGVRSLLFIDNTPFSFNKRNLSVCANPKFNTIKSEPGIVQIKVLFEKAARGRCVVRLRGRSRKLVVDDPEHLLYLRSTTRNYFKKHL